MKTVAHIYVALLHQSMVDKHGKVVTTSLTLNDIQDLARSSKTYGVETLFVVHPSAAMRKLANTLQHHWEIGFGATYNPDRKAAMNAVSIVVNLDEVLMQIEMRSGKLPYIVATSAKNGADRLKIADLRNKLLNDDDRPILLLFGTGWGMSSELLGRSDAILEPIEGPVAYNHLSVRSACAIILDRVLGIH